MALLRRSWTPPPATAVPQCHQAACQFEARLLPGRAGHATAFKCSPKLRPHLNRQPYRARGVIPAAYPAPTDAAAARAGTTGTLVLPATPRSHAVPSPLKPKACAGVEPLPAVLPLNSPRPCGGDRPKLTTPLLTPKPPELRGGARRPARQHERLPGGSARGVGFRAEQALLCGASSAPSGGCSRWSDSKVLYTELVDAINRSSIPSLLRITAQVEDRGLRQWPEYAAAMARLKALQSLQDQLTVLARSTDILEIEGALNDVDVLHVGCSTVALLSPWPLVVAAERRLHELRSVKVELRLAARGTSIAQCEDAIQMAKSLGVVSWSEVCDVESRLRMLHRDADEMGDTSSRDDSALGEMDELLAIAMIAELAARTDSESSRKDAPSPSNNSTEQVLSLASCSVFSGEGSGYGAMASALIDTVELESLAASTEEVISVDSLSAVSGEGSSCGLMAAAIVNKVELYLSQAAVADEKREVVDGVNNAVSEVSDDGDQGLSEAMAVELELARALAASPLALGDEESLGTSDVDKAFLMVCEAVMLSTLGNAVEVEGSQGRSDALEFAAPQASESTVAREANAAADSVMDAAVAAARAESRMSSISGFFAGSEGVDSKGEATSWAVNKVDNPATQGVAAAGVGSKADICSIPEGKASQVFVGSVSGQSNAAVANTAVAVSRAEQMQAAMASAGLGPRASDASHASEGPTSLVLAVSDDDESNVAAAAAVTHEYLCEVLSAAGADEIDVASAVDRAMAAERMEPKLSDATLVFEGLDAGQLVMAAASHGDACRTNSRAKADSAGHAFKCPDVEVPPAAADAGGYHGIGAASLLPEAPPDDVIAESHGSMSAIGLVSEGSGLAASIADDAAVQFAMDMILDSSRTD